MATTELKRHLLRATIAVAWPEAWGSMPTASAMPQVCLGTRVMDNAG